MKLLAAVLLPWLALNVLLTTVDCKKTESGANDAESTAKMNVCFELASHRAHRRAKDIQKIFGALSEFSTGDMTNEEALETIMLGWMTQCYETMDETGREIVLADAVENATLYMELEEKLLGHLPRIAGSDQGQQVFMEAMALVMSQPKHLLKLAKKVMLRPASSQNPNSTNVSKAEEVAWGSRLWLKISPASASLGALGLAFVAAVCVVYKLSKGDDPAAKKTHGSSKAHRGNRPRKTKTG